MMETTQASPCQCGEATEEEKLARIAQIVDDFKSQEGRLIQILHLLAQAIYGYLPLHVQQLIAERLDIPLSEVYGVTTFYSFFSTKPRGEYTIRVCLGTACYVRGGAEIVKRLSQQLGVEVGGTTPDRKFTLEVMRCIGACGLAPAVMVNDTVMRQVNPDKLHRILEMCS
jgi:NADH:ubiquinone oxidoreductase subunit E